MLKNYNKNIFKIIKITFFCLAFLFISTDTILATEINYPTLSGINPNTNPSLPSFVKYLFFFGVFAGFFAVFLSLAFAGAMFFLSSLNPSLRAKAMDRIYGSVSGFLVLALLYLIITTLNPSLGFFSTTSLPATTQNLQQSSTQAVGVYFYNTSNCSAATDSQYSTSNVSDLGTLKNNVNSIATIQDPNTMYVSVLYDTVNFQGKCKIVDPTNKIQSCQTESPPFANSAAIFQYNPKPIGDGVYFYREDCFNDSPFINYNITNNLYDNNYNNYMNSFSNGCGDSSTTNSCFCSNSACLSRKCIASGQGYYKVSNQDVLKSIKNGSAGYLINLDTLKFTGDINSTTCTVPKYNQDCSQYDASGKCTQWACPSLGGQNVSSVVINGPYLVLFIYKNQSDASLGPWTDCQLFPSANDISGMGPLKLRWESIRNKVGEVPNYVEIIPIIK